MYWIHLNSHNFAFKKEEADVAPTTTGTRVINVEKEVYDTIAIGSRYVDGKWSEPISPSDDNPVQTRINELIEKLRNTDWIIVEIIEYQLLQKEPPHNVDEVNKERQAWRDEIAQLTASLSS